MKQPTLKPEMRLISVSELVPWGRNPRRHDLDRIVASIKRFGFRAPLVVNRRDGHYIVEAGHGRLLAAKRLGLKELPCVVVEDDEATATAYALADNRLQELTEWDFPELADILQGLDAGLREVAGWNEKELADLLDSLATPKEGLTPDDEIPELGEPICKMGDLWQLGNHRLLCGDATKREDVERLMGEEKADMVFTDPPYGISIVKGLSTIGGAKPFGRVRPPGCLTLGVLGGDSGRRLKRLTGKVGKPGVVKPRLYFPVFGDDKPFDPAFLFGIAPILVLFGANHYASRLPDSPGWIVWDKGIGEEATFSACELLWSNLNGHIRRYFYRWSGMIRAGNRKEELQDRVHPTQKPVGLCLMILADIEATIVFDPFGGSGSTLIACEKLGRRCYMMEIEPMYCDIVIWRWQNFTGQQALRIE